MPNVIEIAKKKYIVMTEDELDDLIEIVRSSGIFSARQVMEKIK